MSFHSCHGGVGRIAVTPPQLEDSQTSMLEVDELAVATGCGTGEGSGECAVGQLPSCHRYF